MSERSLACPLPCSQLVRKAQNALEKIVKKKIQFTEAETIQQVAAFFSHDFSFQVRGDIKQVSWYTGHWMPPGSYGHGFQGIEWPGMTACKGRLGPSMLPLSQASDIEVGVVSKPMPRMYAAPVPSPCSCQ